MMKRTERIVAVTASSALILDLLSKWLVQSRFILYESVTLLPGLYLTYVMNPGAAFSMFADWSPMARLPLFFAVTLAAMVVIGRYLRELPLGDHLSALALGLVAGGALGNLVDRIRYGMVVDFIEVGVKGVYTWPVFNVADSAVCVGVTFLVWRSFKPYKAD